MERLARCPAIGVGEPDEAVDEDSPRTNLGRLRKERAVGPLQLLLKDLPCREDDLQSPLTLELAQVPAEERRVANERVRRHLEPDVHAGDVELAGRANHAAAP